MNVGNINQKLMDEGGFGKYFHVVLNMCDDDLDPYSYRLLGHYRRVCGMNGSCNEAIKTTARKCQMSLAKARATRQALKTQGYINFDEQINGRSIIITIIDRMEENIQRYVNAKKERAIKSITPIESDRPTPTKSDSPGLPDSIYKEELGNNGKELNTVAPTSLPSPDEIPIPSPSQTVTPIRSVSPKLPPVANAYPSKNGNGTKAINPPAAPKKPKLAKPVETAQKQLPSTPLWNAIADCFYEGVRSNNPMLVQVFNGNKRKELKGIVALECERQHKTSDQLDYKALAVMVKKFAESRPVDPYTQKRLPLKDPVKLLVAYQGWRNTTNRVDCPPQLFFDENCPHHCDKGRIYTFDDKGMVIDAVDCLCVIRLRDERKGIKY